MSWNVANIRWGSASLRKALPASPAAGAAAAWTRIAAAGPGVYRGLGSFTKHVKDALEVGETFKTALAGASDGVKGLPVPAVISKLSAVPETFYALLERAVAAYEAEKDSIAWAPGDGV